MVASKDIRNAIAGLIILAIGIYFIINISAAYISPYMNMPGVVGKSGVSGGLTSSISSIGSTIIMGAGGLAVLMIPLYILKRRSEKDDEKRRLDLEDQQRNAWFREQQLSAERMQPVGYAQQPARYAQQPRGYNQQQSYGRPRQDYQSGGYNQSRQPRGYNQGYPQQPVRYSAPQQRFVQPPSRITPERFSPAERFVNPETPRYPYSPQAPKKPFRYSEEFIKGRKKTRGL